MRSALLLLPVLLAACVEDADDHDLSLQGRQFGEAEGATTMVAVFDNDLADVEVRDVANVRFGRFEYQLPGALPAQTSRVVQLWVDFDDDGRCADGEVRSFVATAPDATSLVVEPGDGDPGACGIVTGATFDEDVQP